MPNQTNNDFDTPVFEAAKNLTDKYGLHPVVAMALEGMTGHVKAMSFRLKELEMAVDILTETVQLQQKTIGLIDDSHTKALADTVKVVASHTKCIQALCAISNPPQES